MPYTIDDSRYPLVIMRMTGWMMERDWEAFYADFDALLARSHPFAAVFDSTGLRAPELRSVQQLAQFMRERTAAIERWHLGAACVLVSPMLRGLLTALAHLDALPMPVATFTDFESALAWASERVLAPTQRESSAPQPRRG